MVQKLQKKSNSTKKQPWLCLEWTEIQRLQNLPKTMQGDGNPPFSLGNQKKKIIATG